MLPHPGQVRNEICAPRRVQSAAANHNNTENEPATFIQRTPKEWGDQAVPGIWSNYDIELWCVVCNDNQIHQHNCEGRYTSNFFK